MISREALSIIRHHQSLGSSIERYVNTILKLSSEAKRSTLKRPCSCNLMAASPVGQSEREKKNHRSPTNLDGKTSYMGIFFHTFLHEKYLVIHEYSQSNVMTVRAAEADLAPASLEVDSLHHDCIQVMAY